MANTTTNIRKEESMTDKAKDVAGNVIDKAKQAASTVAEKAKDVASVVGEKADSAVSSVGSGMQSLAGTIRDKGPSGGVLGGAASGVASALDSSGRYLEEQGLSGIADDMTNLIRRHPIPAVLIGIGLGYLLARMTRS
jgi:F0F1-type ATP synthase assembly protein I